MLSTFIQACIVYVFAWALWKIFRKYILKTSLDNVPGPPPKSFWRGSFQQTHNVDGWDFHRQIAEKYGNVVKLKALFGENVLYVFDPKALHHIVVKDQHIYEETSASIAANSLLLGHGLLATRGKQHRKEKKMLNPVFSIAHMRAMTPLFYDVTRKLQDTFSRKVEKGPQEIDVLSWMTRTALELIGQSGFGYSFDSLTEDSVQHRFNVSAKMLLPSTFKLLFYRNYMLSTLVKIGTPKFRRFLVDHVPWKTLHDVRDIVDVLYSTSIEIVESKRKALAAGDEAVMNQIGQGKDVLSILLRANTEASEEDILTEDEIIGQISTFTFAGMDTTSSALARIIYLISTHQDVQDKLRVEIREAQKQHGPEVPYDDLLTLPYLDAVCRETLRLYPPVSKTNRTARQDVVLPLSRPIVGVNGEEMHEIMVPANTTVMIAILAANRNPEVWGPDSYEWKPERWLAPLPESVTEAHIPGIYSHLMTFLGGGRACIGFKFSQLEMKVVLSLLVGGFRFSLSDKDIFWQMTGIASPTLSKNGGKPALPLIVERIDIE